MGTWADATAEDIRNHWDNAGEPETDEAKRFDVLERSVDGLDAELMSVWAEDAGEGMRGLVRDSDDYWAGVEAALEAVWWSYRTTCDRLGIPRVRED